MKNTTNFTTGRFPFEVKNNESFLFIAGQNLDLYKIFAEDQKGLENFVEELVGQVQINTQNMSFPDLLILMSQRKGAPHFIQSATFSRSASLSSSDKLTGVVELRH